MIHSFMYSIDRCSGVIGGPPKDTSMSSPLKSVSVTLLGEKVFLDVIKIRILR